MGLLCPRSDIAHIFDIKSILYCTTSDSSSCRTESQDPVAVGVLSAWIRRMPSLCIENFWNCNADAYDLYDQAHPHLPTAATDTRNRATD